jgi:ferrous iron transport protein B
VINSQALSQKLGCAVVETVSTSAEGMKAVVDKAISVAGSNQSAPYHQKDVDLSDKAAVQKADRERFTFVNGIVNQVESRKVLTKNRNFSDAIDNVLTNKWLGIPIFAVVMFLVF